jgi:hypothetical protein
MIRPQGISSELNDCVSKYLHTCQEQGCQIFIGTAYQNGKIYQRITKYTKKLNNIPNGHKMDQMDIKFTKVFYAKAFKNIFKLGFLI